MKMDHAYKVVEPADRQRVLGILWMDDAANADFLKFQEILIPRHLKTTMAPAIGGVPDFTFDVSAFHVRRVRRDCVEVWGIELDEINDATGCIFIPTGAR